MEETTSGFVRPLRPADYRLPGYDLAASCVTLGAINILNFGQLPEPISGPAKLMPNEVGRYSTGSFHQEWKSQIIGSEEIDTWKSMQSECLVTNQDVLDGNYTAVLEQMAAQTPEQAKALELHMLDAISRSCDASGQQIAYSQNEPLADAFLRALDGTQIQFAADGKATLSEFVVARQHGQQVDYVTGTQLIEGILRLGSEGQKDELARIVRKQRSEFDAGERSF